MARLGESLTMNLTRSMAGSERRPVALTKKMVRCWGSSTRSPRVAVGVSDAAQGVGEGGGIAAGDVDVIVGWWW